MFILLSISFLLLSTLIMLAIRIWQPRFAFFWLAAAASALAAWLFVFLMQPDLPVDWIISRWGPSELFLQSPTFEANPTNWPFALGLVTLHLATLLTGMVFPTAKGEENAEWKNWIGGLAVAGLSLAVILSGNLLTLLLFWGLLDMVEFAIYLSRSQNPSESERAVILYAARSLGSAVILAAGLLAVYETSSLVFGELSQRTNALLIIGIGIRIGLFPNLQILPANLPGHPGYAAFLRLATTATHIPLLILIARTGVSPDIRNTLLVWSGFTALLSGFSWFTVRNQRVARQDWIVAVSSLVFASAVAGAPGAAFSWGLALILPGSLVLHSVISDRRKIILQALLAVSLCALPFTPAWHHVNLFSGSFHLAWFLFIPAQALLVAGALRHLAHNQEKPGTQERWVWVVYIWGLVLLILVYVYLSWQLLFDGLDLQVAQPDLWQSWPAVASLSLLLAGWLLRPRIPVKWKNLAVRLEAGFSFAFLTKPFFAVYHLFRRGYVFFSSAMESQPGILWTLLLLVLIISLASQASVGE